MSTVLSKKPLHTGVPTLEPVAENPLRARLRILLAGSFYYSGLIGLLHWWKRRRGPQVVILNYHEATGGDLRKHLLYLRRHYRIEHLEDALQELYHPTAGKHNKDRRAVLVLTFDDGYFDNYTQCFALARELHIPFTIFIIPGYIESGHRFWWNEAKNIGRFTAAQTVTLEDQTFHLDQHAEKQALLHMIDTRLRYTPSVATREQFLASAHTVLGVAEAYPEEKDALSITWEEVKEMEQSGWISFGAHTIHHPFLGYLTSYEEVEREVVEGRKVLEERLGHAVRIFAYPGGRPEHIGEHGPQAVRTAGFDWVVTTIGGINTPQSDPLMLRRIEVNMSDHWLVMAAKTSGVMGFFVRLRRLPITLLKTLLSKTYN